MTNTFKTNKAAGFVLLASAIMWCICSVYGVMIFIAARLEYRKAGGMKKAKTELSEVAVETASKNPELFATGNFKLNLF